MQTGMFTRNLSESEVVKRLYAQHQRAKAHEAKNWERWQKNIRFHWGIDSDLGLGQWPASTVADMVMQGRQVGTFNLCRPTVNNFAGEIMQSPFGFKYSPVDSAENSITQKLNSQIYIDKDVCDWRQVELDMVIGGLIMRSDVEMYISKEYAPKDYVGLRTLLPGVVTYDPNWKASRSKECAWADKETYLSAQQILDLYGDTCEKRRGIMRSVLYKAYGERALEALAEWEFKYGAEYGQNTGAIPYQDRPEIWGSMYKVIEHYEMKIIKKKYEFVVTETGDEIPIPEGLDVAEKIQWLNTNVPGWIPDQVFEDEIDEKIQYVTAYCPGISQEFYLSHGQTEIQCGRLQFFPWSAYRMYGEYGGILDAVIDAQETLNYWESMIIHKLQVDGGSGSQCYDPSAFESDSEADRYVKERNNPRAVFRLRKDFLRQYPNGPAVPTVKSQFPSEAYEHLRHIIEMMWPKLSGVTPASRGEAESSSESGVLYNQKKIQAQVERMVVHESLRNWYNDLGEAYLYQHVHMRQGKRISFYDRKEKAEVVWNNRTTIKDESGFEVEVILDDIRSLKRFRHKVDIVESADSPSRKDEIIRNAAAFMDRVPGTKPLTQMDLSHEIAKNIDVWDDDQKALLDGNHQKEKMIAEQQIKTNLATLQLQELQAKMQVVQLQQQLQAAQMQQQQSPAGAANQLAAPGVEGEPLQSPEAEEQSGGEADFLQQQTNPLQGDTDNTLIPQGAL
jgi:hypothetical protein